MLYKKQYKRNIVLDDKKNKIYPLIQIIIHPKIQRHHSRQILATEHLNLQQANRGPLFQINNSLKSHGHSSYQR